MVAVSTVSPQETMNWNGQKSAAKQNMLQGQAQNMYQRQLADMSFSQGLGRMNRQFDQTRMQIPGQFQRRGTFNSGLYRNALSQYAQDRLNAGNELALQHQGQAGGSILQGRGLQDQYAAALQRILGEQYARQATMAGNVGSWI